MEHCAWIYILTNTRMTTFYVGATTNLSSRLYEHLTKQSRSAFTARYNLVVLVHYEGFTTPKAAFAREKYIKGKSRAWKMELIRASNPSMNDLIREWLPNLKDE